jgi:sialic acid synthase SpsE
VTEITIGSRTIGYEHTPYLLAEIGINHNGDIDIARHMIMEAASAGADGVKFQTFIADKLASESADPEQVKYFRQFEFTYDQFAELKAIADNSGVDFLSTPFDIESLRMLVELGVPAIKIASGDLTYYPLIQAATETKLPLIISTGMATSNEIWDMYYSCLRIQNIETILLHCVTSYPTSAQEANLGAIEDMQYEFTSSIGCMIGYSDHTVGNLACEVAAAKCAVLIEKHFTLNHAMPGTDHVIAATPDEFRALRKRVDLIYVLLGSGIKEPQPSEMKNIGRMRRNPSDWLRPLER